MPMKFETVMRELAQRFGERILLNQRQADERIEVALILKEDADEILAQLPTEDVFHSLQILESNATDVGLKSFFSGNRSSLVALEIKQTSVSGQGVSEIGLLPQLRDCNSDVTSGMRELCAWLGTHQTLRNIWLGNVPRFPANFVPFQHLSQLQDLSLTFKTSGSGLLGASSLPELKELTITAPTLTKKCWAEVARVPQLRRFTLLLREFDSRNIDRLGSSRAIRHVRCFCDSFVAESVLSSGDITRFLMWTCEIHGKLEGFLRGLTNVEYLELASPDLDPIEVVCALPASVTELVLRTSQAVSKSLVDQLAHCQPLKMLLINAPGATRIERRLNNLMPQCDVRAFSDPFRGSREFPEG